MSIINRLKAALFYLSTMTFSMSEMTQEIEMVERPRNLLIKFSHGYPYEQHQKIKVVEPFAIPTAKYYLMSVVELPKANDVIKKEEMPMPMRLKGK
jgi:hypothetical protein